MWLFIMDTSMLLGLLGDLFKVQTYKSGVIIVVFSYLIIHYWATPNTVLKFCHNPHLLLKGM